MRAGAGVLFDDGTADISWDQVSREIDAEGHAVIKDTASTGRMRQYSSLYQEKDLFAVTL